MALLEPWIPAFGVWQARGRGRPFTDLVQSWRKAFQLRCSLVEVSGHLVVGPAASLGIPKHTYICIKYTYIHMYKIYIHTDIQNIHTYICIKYTYIHMYKIYIHTKYTYIHTYV